MAKPKLAKPNLRAIVKPLAMILPVALIGLSPLPGASATAQDRDPAYAQARATGAVGEQMDGYLGVVGSGTPALSKMVEDLNIRRKAVFAERAQVQHATVEEYAFTTGCRLIAATVPGEKYQGPDGAWHTRDTSPPLRDSRCP